MQNQYNNYLKRQKQQPINNFKEKVRNSLNGKTVNGLGKMIGGDFDTNFYTDENSTFEQTFWITSYE